MQIKHVVDQHNEGEPDVKQTKAECMEESRNYLKGNIPSSTSCEAEPEYILPHNHGVVTKYCSSCHKTPLDDVYIACLGAMCTDCLEKMPTLIDMLNKPALNT